MHAVQAGHPDLAARHHNCHRGRVELNGEEPLIRATLDTSPLTVGSWRVRIRLTEVRRR